MSPFRRLLTVLSLGLLLAGASACTGPRASASTASGGAITSASVGGTDTQGKLVNPAARLVPTPHVVTVSGSRRPTATPIPTGVFGQGSQADQAALASAAQSASSLRLPSERREIVVVNSTDGEGLWLRREPAGEAIRTWPDHSPMLVIGEDQITDERVWRHVRTADGQTGWAAAEFLAPADEQTIAAALPGLTMQGAPAPVPTNVQARVAVAEATATSAPAAQAQPTTTPTPRKPVSFAGQGVAPTATKAAANGAQTAATATPQPTATAQPTATPVRAPAGATSIEVAESILSVVNTDRGMPIRIGSRPRAGMELAAVQVKVSNSGDSPLAVYRGAFRLSLSDRTRVEPLAGGEAPLPYSTSVAPGDELQGWLTFEVPTGTRIDSLIWSPERDVAYAVGL